jgi:hypothetical protein
VHHKDLAEGEDKISLPLGLARKYSYATIDFKWQYVFSSTVRCLHPTDGYYCRYHLHWTALTKSLRKAALNQTSIRKHVTAHTFRHSFATQLLSNSADINFEYFSIYFLMNKSCVLLISLSNTHRPERFFLISENNVINVLFRSGYY